MKFRSFFHNFETLFLNLMCLHSGDPQNNTTNLHIHQQIVPSLRIKEYAEPITPNVDAKNPSFLHNLKF